MSNLFKMKKIIKYIGIIASLLFLVYGISLFFKRNNLCISIIVFSLIVLRSLIKTPWMRMTLYIMVIIVALIFCWLTFAEHYWVLPHH